MQTGFEACFAPQRLQCKQISLRTCSSPDAPAFCLYAGPGYAESQPRPSLPGNPISQNASDAGRHRSHMPRRRRKTVQIAIQPLEGSCPRCDAPMRRDYRNRRTIICPDRTILLTLQILRCKNSACPEYNRPYRPEIEWHFAMPGVKFGFETCSLIFAKHLQGKSNNEIQRALAKIGVRSSPRSVSNIIQRFDKLFRQPTIGLAAETRSGLEEQGKAFLDILVACVCREHVYILAYECISKTILATACISNDRIDAELSGFIDELMKHIPVPLAGICCSNHDRVSWIVMQRLMPRHRQVVRTDGRIGRIYRKSRRRPS